MSAAPRTAGPMTLQGDRQRRDCPPVGHPFDLSGRVAVVTGGNSGIRCGYPAGADPVTACAGNCSPVTGGWGRSDLAGLAVYLASAASEYHTGDVLTVDGGYGSC